MKLLKFYSNFCNPCKVLERIMDVNNIPHDNIDIEEETNADIVSKYNIKTVPTLILIEEDGTEVNRHVGMMNLQQLKEFTNIANK